MQTASLDSRVAGSVNSAGVQVIWDAAFAHAMMAKNMNAVFIVIVSVLIDFFLESEIKFLNLSGSDKKN